MQDEGILTEVITAYSRTQEKKVYVQHRLAERKQDITEWANNRGYFFMCGSTSMGNDCLKVLGECFDLDKLRKEKRIVEEMYG